jgi:hypothetical protein
MLGFMTLDDVEDQNVAMMMDLMLEMMLKMMYSSLLWSA